MILAEAKKLRKGSRVLWEDEGSNLPVFLGTVNKKQTDKLWIKWDDEEDIEPAYLNKDDKYFFDCLTKVNK